MYIAFIAGSCSGLIFGLAVWGLTSLIRGAGVAGLGITDEGITK